MSQHHSTEVNGTGLGKGEVLGVFVFGFFVCLVLFDFVKPWYFVLVFLKLYPNLKLLEVMDSTVHYIRKQKVQITKLVVSASLDDLWTSCSPACNCLANGDCSLLIQCVLNL